jgi:hypothetical protein
MSREPGFLRSVSIDRLDGPLGYVQGNVVLTCLGANLARSNHPPDEMRKFVQAIRLYSPSKAF